MNMTLSKRGDYVMRAAIFLARSPRGHSRKIREVVADTEVPPAFASQILSDLVRAGLAVSRAGRDGGYQLSRDASAITALEIVEAAEGPLATERCALGEGPCKWDQVCPLHDTWFSATQRVREVLANTTLAQLAQRDREIEDGSYLPADSHRSQPPQVEVTDEVQVESSADHARTLLSTPQIDVEVLVRSAVNLTVDNPQPFEVEGAMTPERSSSSPGTLPTQSFQLVWRIRGSQAASHVEAELRVTPVDEDRCSLTLKATWHHEDPDQDALDHQRRAERVIRFFLRALAGELERAATTA
jgi:Rrf2 family protein